MESGRGNGPEDATATGSVKERGANSRPESWGDMTLERFVS
jgi:hypothetical protein